MYFGRGVVKKISCYAFWKQIFFIYMNFHIDLNYIKLNLLGVSMNLLVGSDKTMSLLCYIIRIVVNTCTCISELKVLFQTTNQIQCNRPSAAHNYPPSFLAFFTKKLKLSVTIIWACIYMSLKFNLVVHILVIDFQSKY